MSNAKKNPVLSVSYEDFQKLFIHSDVNSGFRSTLNPEATHTLMLQSKELQNLNAILEVVVSHGISLEDISVIDSKVNERIMPGGSVSCYLHCVSIAVKGHLPELGQHIEFTVIDNSMNGGLINDSKEGAELSCRELNRDYWKNTLKDNPLGWVVIKNDNMLFKDIKHIDMETGEMTLGSRSGLPEHQDFTINMEDVSRIWKVIKRTQ